MSRRSARSRILALAIGCAVVAMLGVYGAEAGSGGAGAAAPPTGGAASGSSAPDSAATTTIAVAHGKPGTALAVLATLAVKGRAPMTGYDRVGDFGTAWFDANRNGCDTRDDVLRRDLTGAVLSGTCRVMSGTLADPYTKSVIHFVRGIDTSTAVQIDHMVPLGDAWVTGAQRLTSTQRIDLANDPINLLAVDGPTNEAKGDGDAATWLPPNKAFRCTYVAHQVGVKAAYHLWVTPAEHDAIARILATCPSTPVPVSTLAAAAFSG